MVSKAFCKSMKIPQIYHKFFSVQFEISSIKSIKARDVDLFCLNPYWLSDNKLCFSIKFRGLESNMFSNTVAGEIQGGKW